jgi:cysteine desulfurase/selenocysteine lyase
MPEARPQSETPAAQSVNSAPQALDMEHIRRDFPILQQTVHGNPLVYLDSAATAQRPEVVLRAMESFYRETNSNVHRGVHKLSVDATRLFEDSREKVRRFLNAPAVEEIVFTRGTTEAINLVAQTFGRARVGEGDEIVVSCMEHHSNIVPWQLLCEERGANLRVAPIDDRGQLIFEEYEKLLNGRTRLVAVAHVSNALGTINPLREIIAVAHERVIPVLVDGAQAVPHMAVDVSALDCDFYAMPPWQGGGDMILSVTFEKTTYNDLPYKFEAGTPNIAGAIGMGAGLDYVQSLGLSAVEAHEADLVAYAHQRLSEIEGLRFVGTAADKAGVVSFTMDQAHPHDIGTIVDRCGVAIRAGHHCAQPVMDRFGLTATARASFGLYNSRADVDALHRSLLKVQELFA